MRIDIDELIERIEGRYDCDAVVDILGLSVRELLEAFPDLLMEKLHLFNGVDNGDE